MVNRKSIRIASVVVASISALALAYVTSQCARDTGLQPISKRGHVNVDGRRAALPPGVHGKIQPPADIRVEVIDAGEVGGPVKLAVHAASLVPVVSGTITMARPPLGDEPEGTELLWSNVTPGFVAQSVEYTTAPLPAGQYRFTAVFEFVPDRQDAETMIVAESLCLDIRPDTVLSSAVSFDQIKRVELMQELEGQGRNATNGRVPQIKATDSDAARRISELNRIEDEGDTPGVSTGQSIETDSGLESGATPRSGRPAPEVAVPARLKHAP